MSSPINLSNSEENKEESIFVDKPVFISESDISDTSDSSDEENELEKVVVNDEKDDSDIEDVDKPVVLSIFQLFILKLLETEHEVLEDPLLTDIPDIEINADDKFTLIGKIYKIVDDDVVIESIENQPYVEVYTLLLNNNNQIIGKVKDIIGSVSHPFYVLYNQYNGLLYEGMEIYILNRLCKFIENNEIKKIMSEMKGTDASNQYDEEPTNENERIEIECVEDINGNSENHMNILRQQQQQLQQMNTYYFSNIQQQQQIQTQIEQSENNFQTYPPLKKVEIDTSRYSSELPGKYKDDKMEEEKDDDNENNDLLSGTMFG